MVNEMLLYEMLQPPPPSNVATSSHSDLCMGEAACLAEYKRQIDFSLAIENTCLINSPFIIKELCSTKTSAVRSGDRSD